MNRRFYRSKYDARNTLEVFSAKLRDETDLEALNEELVEAVRENMHPPTSLYGCAPRQPQRARRSGRLGDIHAINDRYDHDVDELMA